jgi:hypothetical protein
MARLGVSLGPMTPETLIEEVGRLPGVVRELADDGPACSAPSPHHVRVALPRARPHGAERRLGPWHL